MAISSDDLVKREVFYCVSSLVSTLAQGYGATGLPVRSEVAEMAQLCEQAMELHYPLDDYESAAEEAGFHFQKTTGFWHADDQYNDSDESMLINFADAGDVCREQDIEPHQREVFEHWIVSDWLADKLEAKGEKVDRDFAGLIVWARTTTGQGIAQDYVVQQITEELNAA